MAKKGSPCLDKPKEITKTSYFEKIVREFFFFYLESYDAEYNYRPNWLKNKKTGKNLELDIFYPDVAVAIECQGSSSHRLSSYQVEKDKLKENLCKKEGVFLLSINSPIELLREKTKHNLSYRTGVSFFDSPPYSLIRKITNYRKTAEKFWKKEQKEKKEKKRKEKRKKESEKCSEYVKFYFPLDLSRGIRANRIEHERNLAKQPWRKDPYK